MDFLTLIEQSPCFPHLTDKDARLLLPVSCEIPFLRGERIDLRNSRKVFFVSSGLFRTESALNRGESVIFGAGSVLGNLPFSDEIPRGVLTAVTPATAFAVDCDDLTRVLVSSFRTARGYLRLLGKFSESMSAPAKAMADTRPRIVTVTGSRKAGKTLSAILLASELSKKGNTILLDLSVSGTSLFDYFQCRLLPPLSQKKAGLMSDSFLEERITQVRSGLDILNLSFGAKVAVDAGILSPVLFYLSRSYKYLVIDCGADDPAMTAEALSCSDFACIVPSGKKELLRLRSACDRALCDGQELFVCENRKLSRRTGVPGDMALSAVSIHDEGGICAAMDSVSDGAAGVVERICGHKTLYLLPDKGVSSLSYSGLFAELSGKSNSSALISSWGGICMSFYSFLSAKDAEKAIISFFSEERLRQICTPVFPKEYLYPAQGVAHALGSIPHDVRLE
ncbi:MAG: hypothetical protein ACRCUT_01700, partial [Spirochaetota bacterium]